MSRPIISFYHSIDSLTTVSRRGFSPRSPSFGSRQFFRGCFPAQRPNYEPRLRVGWLDNCTWRKEAALRGWLAFCPPEPGHEGFNATRGGFMRYSIKRVARHRSIKSSPGEPIGSDGKYRRLRRLRRLFRSGLGPTSGLAAASIPL